MATKMEVIQVEKINKKIILGEENKKVLGGKKNLFENLLIKNMHERMNNDEILNKNLGEGQGLSLTKFEIENAKMVAKLIFEAEDFENENLILLGGELAFALFVGERLKSAENLIKIFEKIIEFAKAKPIVLTPKSGLWYKMRDACWQFSPILLALNKNEEELILKENGGNKGEKSLSENLEFEKKILDKRIENTLKLFEEEKYGKVLLKNQGETSEGIKQKLNEGNEYAWRIKNVLNFVVSKIPDALLTKPKIVTEIPPHMKYYDETGLY